MSWFMQAQTPRSSSINPFSSERSMHPTSPRETDAATLYSPDSIAKAQARV